MFVRRPTSPLSLESPASNLADGNDGDDLFSDSENDLDETARATKRRRIEQLGRDYLEGKELMIFTASLKGPFEDGWVNPWKRTKGRDRERGNARGSRSSDVPLKPGARDQSVSRRTEQRIRSDSHRPSPSEEEPALEQQIGNGRRFRDRSACHRPSAEGHATTSNSKNTFSEGKPGRRRSKQKRADGWLKKDGKGMDNRMVNKPKSPSPTPQCRPNSRKMSGTEGLQGKKNDMGNMADEVRVTPFTPVNGRRSYPVTDGRQSDSASVKAPGPVTSTNEASDNRANNGASGFPKPRAPASAKERPTVNPTPNDTRSISISKATGRISAKAQTETRYFSENFAANTRGQAHAHQTQISKTRNINTLSAEEVGPADGNHSAGQADPKRQLTNGGNTHNLESAKTESDNITSAQIVSGKANFPDALMSLVSTEGIAGAHDACDANDLCLSTQPPLVMTQDSAQDNLASPNNVTPARSVAAITPFHTFYTPGRDGARSSVEADRAANGNGQAKAFDDSTPSKTVQFGSKEGGAEDHASARPAAPLSLQSSQTVLPLTLAASTNGTRQQDGQGIAGFNDFDLDQAIADAGSFLQSWDIDRELSLQSHKNNPSSFRPVPELKEASQG